MTDIDLTDDEIGEDVLPVEIEDVAIPVALELQPWHTPRKQYVRERQWRHYAAQLIRTLAGKPSLAAGRLNYLTLPGTDYFDVEILGALANEAGLQLHTTGFLADTANDPIKARSQFRADSLIKKGLMIDNSITFHQRFESIADPATQAYREVRTRAPFHVINIDACGSIAAPAAHHSNRLIDAMHQLIGLQFDRMQDPWLLFLTTDASPNSVSEQVRTALEGAIRTNAAQSEEFRDGAVACLGAEGEDIEAAIQGVGDDASKYAALYSLGLSKWILHNADDVGWDVKCQQFYAYSTRPDGSPSMTCLAYEFRPRPVRHNDRFGAVTPMHPPAPHRPDFSLKALERARAMENLDTYLAEHEEIRREYAAKQRTLLEGAGYQAAALAEFDERNAPITD